MPIEQHVVRTSETLNINSVARFILTLQRESGDIPWQGWQDRSLGPCGDNHGIEYWKSV